MSRERPAFIARYEIQAPLGQGAMGTVYKARDPQLDRIVAIKTVRNDLGLADEHYAAYKIRFFQEAKAAGRLNHPNIVAVYDVLDVEHSPYIVMEYVESDTLANLIKARGTLSTHEAVDVTRQICLALEYAHARGIVHRDIKPANILIGTNGEVKVSDFGIARIEGQDVTMTGAFLGTPSYMSPEQIQGSRVDGRSDLFSLGAVLYEALTGGKPFPGKDTIAVLHSIVHDDPVPVHERNSLVHRGLNAVTTRALAKNRDQRYPNARAFADALGEVAAASRPGATSVPQRAERLGGLLSMRARHAALFGVAGVVLATAGGLAWWRYAAPTGIVEVQVPPGAGTAGDTPRPNRPSVTEPKNSPDGDVAVTKPPADPQRQETPTPVAANVAASPSVDSPTPLNRPSTVGLLPRDGGDKKATAAAPGPTDRPASAGLPATPPSPAPGVLSPRTPAAPAPGPVPPLSGAGAAPAGTGGVAALPRDMARPPTDTRPVTQPSIQTTRDPSEPLRPIAPPGSESDRAGLTPPRPPHNDRPAVPSKSAAIVPAPRPAAPRADIAGPWQGRYQCQREQIGFSLNVTSVDGNRIAAIFEFFPLPGTLSFPRGSFNMSGEFDRADGSVRLRSAGWIQRPLGFQSHDIEGQLEPNGETINGRVLTTGCAHFVLARP